MNSTPRDPYVPAPRKPTLRQLKDEDRLQAYGVTDCEVCGAEMAVYNMVGMGTCPRCNFARNPTRRDFNDLVLAARLAWRNSAAGQIAIQEEGGPRVLFGMPGDDRARLIARDEPLFAVGATVRLDGGALYEVRDRELAQGRWFYTLAQGGEKRAGLVLEGRLSPPSHVGGPHFGLPHFFAPRELADVEIAGIRAQRRLEPSGLIRMIPRLGPWCRPDRRLRTSPHGDALATTTRSRLRRKVDALDALFRTQGSVPAFWHAPVTNVFTLHSAQRHFLEMVERGEQPVLCGKGRSSGWDAVFHLAEGIVKERLAPWRADAEACENGMGC